MTRFLHTACPGSGCAQLSNYLGRQGGCRHLACTALLLYMLLLPSEALARHRRCRGSWLRSLQARHSFPEWPNEQIHPPTELNRAEVPGLCTTGLATP